MAILLLPSALTVMPFSEEKRSGVAMTLVASRHWTSDLAEWHLLSQLAEQSLAAAAAACVRTDKQHR